MTSPSYHAGIAGLPWKRLVGAALVAAAGGIGAMFLLSTIDLSRGYPGAWLRLSAGLLALAGGLLGLMEFHRRRTHDIARGRVVEPMAGGRESPYAFRTAIGLASLLLAVATALALSVDVAVQLSAAQDSSRRSGLDALRDARNRVDPERGDIAEGAPTSAPGGPSLVAPDTSGLTRGAVDEKALGNLLSDEAVFEVLDETIGAPHGRQLLLRGFVVEAFDGAGTLRERAGETVPLGGPNQTRIELPYRLSATASPPSGEVRDLRFRFFSATRGLVFSPHELTSLNTGRAELNRGTLALTASLGGRRTYSVRVRIPTLGSRSALAAEARGSLPGSSTALSFPPVRSKDRRRAYREIDRLAAQVTKDATNDMGRVLAVVQHLRDSFAYELYHLDFLNPEGCLQLINRGSGSCTHFSSIATLMLRRMGIPTRIAAGYVAREPLTGDQRGWLVRERDGHAWIEVHFKGLGWLAFDPTPGDATVGGTLSGWSPLNEELEPRGSRRGAGAATTALAAFARAGMDVLRQRGVSAWWLLAAAAGALVLRTVIGQRRTGTVAPVEPASPKPLTVVQVGGDAENAAVGALFQALAERGLVQPRGTTPRAFARRVEADLPGAFGFEESVLAMLRAAAGRGPLQTAERSAILDLADRIRSSEARRLD